MRARPWWLITLLAAPAPAIPPRYQYEPGRTLIYRVRIHAEAGSGPGRLLEEQILRVTCLREQGERWLLLVDVGPIGSEIPGQARGVLLWIDRRGRRSVQPETLPALWAHGEWLELWPLLPEAIAPDPQWRAPPDELGRVWTFQRLSEDRIAFTAREPEPLDRLLPREHRGHVDFDLQHSIVRQVRSRLRTPAAPAVQLRTTRLEWSQQHDAAWLRARTAEVEAWLRALRVEQRLVRAWATQPGRITADLARIGRLWQDLNASMPDRDSPLRDLVRSRLERLPRDAQRWRGWAAFDRAAFGHAAASWSLTDARGRIVRSDTDPPRVTVECFWSLAGEPSLRALRSLQGLRRRYPAVRFVAIHVGTQPDALTRAAPLLAHLTAVDGGVAMRAQAGPELPLVRVLDRLRRVRAILHGWRPDSADLLAELIARVQREGD